ncbi:MAG: lysophospholipid acyltransferase family protein [Verrucomicrobiota bacterium]
MDVQPYQTPPRWWSPMLNPGWFRFWGWIRKRIRVKYHHIVEIEIQGLENLKQCIDNGHGVLIAPNHSCHADPSIVYWVADQLKTPFYFMAAWQIFLRANWLRLLVLRQHGCFSVDRDGTDIRAFRQAVDILQNKPYPMVIFPEGEIYHFNKRVTPFRDGPAAIALTAAKHSKRPVTCIPCGIRYQYTTNPMEELLELMDRLEERILWRPKRNLILRKRIYEFAEAILGLKEKEYMEHTQTGTLPERIQSLAEHILRGLEDKYGITDRTPILPERVKACRRHAIQRIEDTELPEREHDDAKIDLDDLFVVTQLFSYPGTYVSEKPTIEEMAEVMDKFEEDVLRKPTASIRATRRAVIAFGKPIPVEPEKGNKERIHCLTEQLENEVQTLLDNIQLK